MSRRRPIEIDEFALALENMRDARDRLVYHCDHPVYTLRLFKEDAAVQLDEIHRMIDSVEVALGIDLFRGKDPEELLEKISAEAVAWAFESVESLRNDDVDRIDLANRLRRIVQEWWREEMRKRPSP